MGSGHGAGWIAAALAAVALAVLVWRDRRRRFMRLVRRVVTDHARLLAVKQKQLVIHDGYGNYRLEGWIAHVDYFIGHVVLREAQAEGYGVGGVTPGSARWTAIRHELLAIVNGLPGSRPGERPPDPGEARSGEDYERLCRDLLEAEGWRVAATPATGDQGADLIAEAGRRRIVIQCKFYGRPVGNKAVQEAAAALAFHAGDRAAVVANAGFTRSAAQLAAANDVLLLHHDQLADLARLVGLARAPAR